MNCSEIKELLEEYIFGELDEGAKREVETHLESCPECKSEYGELKESVSTIHDTYGDIRIPDELKNITVIESKKSKRWFSNKVFAALAACIITVLIATVTTVNFLPGHKVSAEDYRGGFSLAPQNADSAGISPSSKYVLKSLNKISIGEIEKNLSIDGEPAPVITQEGSNTFIIAPSREFDQNKLYTFRIKIENKNDIVWTFQTRAVFKIVSAFPADKTNEVPVNTGIEIYFSHEDFENVDNYFEISPAVEGRFERHKRAVVFVPKELKEATLYTVKINRGLKLTGTNYSLSQDYVFRFETGSKSGNPVYGNGNFNYNKSLNEYSPDEKPYIPFNYYVDKYKGNIKVKTEVYAYKSLEAFITDVGKRGAIPYWAYRSLYKNTIPVKGLDRVLEFQQEIPGVPNGEEFIKVPSALPVGFYLIDSKFEDVNFQTFIEVTNIGMYIMKSSNKTILWLNDLKTKEPISDAVVSMIGGNESYYSDSNGLVYFDSFATGNGNEPGSVDMQKYFKVKTGDNKTAVLNCYSNAYGIYNDPGASTGEYWNLLQLDRNLFKPDDVVNFWGFIKDRYSDEKIDDLTVEIGQGYRYYGFGGKEDYTGSSPMHYFPTYDQPMVREVISAENGIFKGSIKLPVLAPGGYQLMLKKGKKVIASSYLNIENYVKPPYKIEITKDREAIFPGQKVNFNVKASFFEGTGVPDLSVNYDIGAYNLGENQISSSNKTDSQGNISVEYIPKPNSSVQGEQYVGINCRATLPEIGETYQNDGVRVFVNDVNVKLTASSKDNKGVINAEVNKITLDRINNGTSKDNNDYIGEAVPGKELTVTVYRNTWTRFDEGEYYDYINKVTQKRYRYAPRKDAIKTFTIKTGNDGKVSYEFDVPKLEEGYYTAEANCTDNLGRNMKFDVYVGNDGGYGQNTYDENRYYLDGGKESYSLGEKVNVTFKKGKKNMPEGRYLFIKTQNGIREYTVKEGPGYSFDFKEKDVPNVYVTGIYFNGLTYVQSEQFNAVYDWKEKNLSIEAKMDKASYKPGDEVTIDLTAKDKKGMPKKAVVNVSLVDEALFKLNEQNIDTLVTLYNGVPSGVEFSYESHVNSGREMVMTPTVEVNEVANFGGYQDNIKFDKEVWRTGSKVQLSFSEYINPADFSGYKANVAVRQDFKDAAYFTNVTLDDNGHGTLKFKLPDNVTAWRVTLSGVTTDLSAGSGKVALNVTLPFFINYTLNSTYLSGDKPVLGVNAYGNDLKKGDDVTFEVSSLTNPDRIVKGKGKAFERVDIPLWEMKEGSEDIIIKAQSASGLGDSIKHTIKTVRTYHQIEKAVDYDLKQGMKIDGGDTGNTKLIFSDKSRGRFLPELTNLMYTCGNRVDQKLSEKVASELINKYFRQGELELSDSSFKVTDYQRQDGGIALLPYGNSDADVSAKLSSLIKNDVDAMKLKQYFYSILLDDSPGLKGNALYGLAVLREPVLLNLDKAAAVENADIKDLLYIALAYCELGEFPKAAGIFNIRISPKIEKYSPFYRVNTGKDNDDILECTSLAAILASRLDKSQKEGLYQYCIRNSTEDILINIEKLLYITGEMEKSKGGTVKFSYSFNGDNKTKVLKDGETFEVTVPSKELSGFDIKSVEGDISLTSIFYRGIEGLEKPDPNLKVERSYSQKYVDTNNFRQGDIVRVEIKWNVDSKAIDGEYEITDYLPSGLKPIENPSNMGVEFDSNTPFKRIDGQKVTLYVYKGWENNRSLVYYARIVSPGVYKAEAPMIQSTASRDSMNLGKPDMVKVD